MMLGWSDGGSPGLRAAHADRDEVRRRLDLARDEGRLDPVEHDRRLEAVRTAKTRGQLALTAADLPAKKGERRWLDGARIRSADRELAATVLAAGTADGRLSAEQYESRTVGLVECETYDRLKRILHGLPGWPGADETKLRPTAADREAARAELARAVSDGRVETAEHDVVAAKMAAARRLTELTKITDGLAARASDAAKAATTEQLARALDDGRLDHDEHTSRAARVRPARTLADLARLTGDLSGKARRPSNTERAATAATLKAALDDGRLDLDEYDERLKAAYAATTAADTRRLLADLATPPRYPSRGPLDLAFDHFVCNSALLSAPRDLADRVHPKPLWKIGLLGTFALWGWAIVGMGPLLLGLTLGAGWIPVFALLALNNKVARIGSGAIAEREAAAVAGIARALRSRPELRSCEAELEQGTVTIRFRPAKGVKGVPGALFDEAVRLAWQSRLYPLQTVVVSNTEDHSDAGLRLTIVEHHRRELLHRHGKRPYGPLPAETD